MCMTKAIIKPLEDVEVNESIYGLYAVIVHGKPVRVYSGRNLGKGRRVKHAIPIVAWQQILEKLIEKELGIK